MKVVCMTHNPKHCGTGDGGGSSRWSYVGFPPVGGSCSRGAHKLENFLNTKIDCIV